MEGLDGKDLFLIILFLFPFIGIQIKLFKAFFEREAVKEILGKEKFYWMLEQYDAKRKEKYKIEAAFRENLRLFISKIKNFFDRLQFIRKTYEFVFKPMKIEE